MIADVIIKSERQCAKCKNHDRLFLTREIYGEFTAPINDHINFVDSSSVAIYKRKLEFLAKLHRSEYTICRLFEKNIDELDIVHEH